MTIRERLFDLLNETTGMSTAFKVDTLIENGVTIPVQCKDCKWFDPNEDVMPQSGSCAYHEMIKMDWDFCSRAKKRRRERQ